jgi:xanthine dehydrogenase iron-sulfur cluster and FAD-binding subunit A
MARQSHANAPTAAVVTGRKSDGPRRILGAMKPAPFGYVRPESIDDAVARLAADAGAVPIAGGQTLLGQLNLRLRRPTCLVDLGAIEGLGAIAPLDGGVRIGAMATMRAVERSPLVAKRAPLLGEALAHVGSPQVRARGTIGGTLAHGDPVAEAPAALVALGARVVVRGPSGERTCDAAELHAEPGELVVAIEVPAQPEQAGWAFAEISLRRASRALACAAALACVDADGALSDVRVVVADRERRAVALDVGALVGLRAGQAAVDDAVREAVRSDAAPLAAEVVRQAASGVGVAPAGRSASDAPRVARPRVLSHEPTEIELTVNGRPYIERVEPRLLLSDLLRDRLGLTATHVGCEHGVCGACNVLVDGRAVRSCLMLGVQAEGRDVRTVEGLREAGELAELSAAFVERHALQCGFCTPGFLVTLAEARAEGVAVDAAALSGNLCRCTGYAPILAAASG